MHKINHKKCYAYEITSLSSVLWASSGTSIYLSMSLSNNSRLSNPDKQYHICFCQICECSSTLQRRQNVHYTNNCVIYICHRHPHLRHHHQCHIDCQAKKKRLVSHRKLKVSFSNNIRFSYSIAVCVFARNQSANCVFNSLYHESNFFVRCVNPFWFVFV